MQSVKEQMWYVIVLAGDKTATGPSPNSSSSQQTTEENIEMQAENIDNEDGAESQSRAK